VVNEKPNGAWRIGRQAGDVWRVYNISMVNRAMSMRWYQSISENISMRGRKPAARYRKDEAMKSKSRGSAQRWREEETQPEIQWKMSGENGGGVD